MLVGGQKLVSTDNFSGGGYKLGKIFFGNQWLAETQRMKSSTWGEGMG